MLAFLEGCDIGGFGVIRFDLPILQAEFRRAGLELDLEDRRVIDALVIYHTYEPRDLTSAYEKYCGKSLEAAHSSAADVRAAAEILDSQVAYYTELPRDLDDLHKFCHLRDPDWIDEDGKLLLSEEGPLLGFGQYRGRLLKYVAQLDPDYLTWVLNADFSALVKNAVIDALRSVTTGEQSQSGNPGGRTH